MSQEIESIRLASSISLKPNYRTELFKQEIERVVNPTGEVSKMIAIQNVIKMMRSQCL